MIHEYSRTELLVEKEGLQRLKDASLSVLFKIPLSRKWQKNNEEATIAQGVKIFAQSAF